MPNFGSWKDEEKQQLKTLWNARNQDGSETYTVEDIAEIMDRTTASIESQRRRLTKYGIIKTRPPARRNRAKENAATALRLDNEEADHYNRMEVLCAPPHAESANLLRNAATRLGSRLSTLRGPFGVQHMLDGKPAMVQEILAAAEILPNRAKGVLYS